MKQKQYKTICSYEDRKTNVGKVLWKEMMKNGLFMKVGHQNMNLLKGQKKLLITSNEVLDDLLMVFVISNLDDRYSSSDGIHDLK